MRPDLLIPNSLVEDITYRLRRDFEKGGGREHIVLMTSLIAGYLTKFPGLPLIPAEDATTGLAPHFVQWLKQNVTLGDNDNSEELYAWIIKYPA